MFRSALNKIFRRRPADLLKHGRARSEATPESAVTLSEAVRNIEARLRSVSDMTYGVTIANTIRMLDFDLERHPRYGDPKRLLRHAFQVCSQNGEDGMIHEIFRRIGAPSRTFVEIGVGNGRECNTAFLLSQGWNGYWIDGDAAFVDTIKDRADLGSECLKYSVAHVSKENVAALLQNLGVPKEFDVLSLDIDQNTFYVWEGLSEYRPRLVVIEYNAAIPADVDWKVRYDPNRSWDLTQNFGASLRALEILGEESGYSLVGCNFTGVNAFFVRSDLVADHFAAPLTSENHYEPPRYHFTIRRCHAGAILDRTDTVARPLPPR